MKFKQIVIFRLYSVILLEAAARNDIDEGKVFISILCIWDFIVVLFFFLNCNSEETFDARSLP